MVQTKEPGTGLLNLEISLQIIEILLVYIETGRSTTATTVQLATLAATSGAKWRVRIKNVTEMNCWMIDSIKI